MLIKFFPYKIKITKKVFLILFVPIMPFLFLYCLDKFSSNSPLIAIILLLSLLIIVFAFEEIKSIFKRLIFVYSDERCIQYGLFKIMWCEVDNVKIINTTYINGITDVALDFDRYLFIHTKKNREMFIPL